MPERSKGFLPEDYLERRLQWRTNIISLTLFVVVMGAVVAAFFVTDQKRAQVRQLQEQVNRDFEEAAKRLEQLETLQQKKQQMIRKAQVTAALLERVPRSLILSELVNAMPTTLSLTELTLDSRPSKNPRKVEVMTAMDQARQKSLAGGKASGVPEPQVPELDVAMQLVGVAPTDLEVSQFMTALGNCDLFTEVTLVFSEQSTIKEQTMRRFRVDLLVNQSLDMTKFVPSIVQKDMRTDVMGIGKGPIQITPDGKARPVRDDVPMPSTAGVPTGN